MRVPDDPEELQAFAWKPEYRLLPEPGAAPVWILPGHLVIADPRALRMGFLYRVLQIAYRTRNRPIEKRRGPMARAVLGSLLWHDVLHVLSLRPPTLTWTVLTRGLRLARMLRAGTLTAAELERLATAVGVAARHRRRFPERGVRIAVGRRARPGGGRRHRGGGRRARRPAGGRRLNRDAGRSRVGISSNSLRTLRGNGSRNTCRDVAWHSTCSHAGA